MDIAVQRDGNQPVRCGRRTGCNITQGKNRTAMRQTERIEKFFSQIEFNGRAAILGKDYRLGYWVTWNGMMRFCSFMNEPDLSVRDRAFSQAWQELIQYEEALDWPEECKTCKVQKACMKCAGTLAAECGSPHRVTEEFCNKVKKYYDDEKGEWDIWEHFM